MGARDSAHCMAVLPLPVDSGPVSGYGAGLSIAGVTVAVDGGERRAPDIGVASRYRRRSRIGVRDMLS